jgi:hypothetical protein
MSEHLRLTYLLVGYIPDRALLPNNVRSARTANMLRQQQRKDVLTLLKTHADPPADLGSKLWCRFIVGWPKEAVLRKKGWQGVIRWQYKAFPDPDNLNAALKGALDAVQDRLGVNDRHIHLATPGQERAEGDGWLRIEIGERVE